MAQLIVRNLDEDIVDALKARAEKNGRSAEAEHREILRSVLRGPGMAVTLWEYLASMPEVSFDDEDLVWQRDLPREVDL
jgi:plasmid stability protein